ncbi:MAG: rRNA methyltransferase [Chitinophagaceae bacterium]|nr:rRNA methyltransferase [Chitinophagaceae bacterium]
MSNAPKKNTTEKINLHPRNKHRLRYDFPALTGSCPELKQYIAVNEYGDESVDFSNPEAVKTLNKALLKYFYNVSSWDIPASYLCPPIPGRADYIHYTADLLAESNEGLIPKGTNVRVLDIGVGANCVYPLIGNHEYGWRFVGTDIDIVALKAAQHIVKTNGDLEDVIDCRFQDFPTTIFRGVIRPGEVFDLTICNPPFHASAEEAQAGTRRKWNNLGTKPTAKPMLNFGGQQTELWCEGGEAAFLKRMIEQSVEFSSRCLWFTSLVSKKENLPAVYWALKQTNAMEVKTIDMAQGQKSSRFVAWTFFSKQEQKEWSIKRWNR